MNSVAESAVAVSQPEGDALQQVFEVLPGAVAICRNAGQDWLNASAREIDDWLRAEGRELSDVLHEAAQVSSAALTAGSAQMPLVLRRRDGAERVYTLAMLPLFQLPERPIAFMLTPAPRPASGQDLLDAQAASEIALARIEEVQRQLLQADRLSTIGQLAAGVAHEINNPIGYVQSNLETLRDYLASLFRLIAAQDTALRHLRVHQPDEAMQIEALREEIDFEFLSKDLPTLLSESQEGISRVRKIIQDLREFSRAGHSEAWAMADLHAGIDSTINIVWNELKYKVELVKEYGQLPPIECLPSQLNQVFMNILVNAGHAIEKQGRITIATRAEDDHVFVEISDTGKGIDAEYIERVFEPFFTTKPVGKGTGLGLSISYGIVRKHGGDIDVRSETGIGTTFVIRLPVRQPQHDDKAGL